MNDHVRAGFDLRLKDSEGSVPSTLTDGHKPVFLKGVDRSKERGAIHASHIKDVGLDDILKLLACCSFDDQAEDGVPEVGVHGAGLGQEDGIAAVDIFDQVLLGAGPRAGKAGAGRTGASGDFGESHLEPDVGGKDGQVHGDCSHVSQGCTPTGMLSRKRRDLQSVARPPRWLASDLTVTSFQAMAFTASELVAFSSSGR